MKPHHPPWNSVAITAAVSVLAMACLSVGTAAVEATGTGQVGSHSHMRQHKHGSGDGHRHHVPKRKQTQPPPKLPERQDPKRLPRDEWSNPQLELLQDNALFHDREHLKEELPEYLNLQKVEEMSDRELDYHYFRMHDFDKNFLLDGLELLAALGHVVGEDEDEEEEGDGEGAEEGGGGKEEEEKRARVEDLKGLSEDEKRVVRNFRYQKWEDDWKFYIELVDGVLNNNDLNKDGFLSWSEFLRGRKRDI